LFHLTFVDDILIFAEASEEQIGVIFMLLISSAEAQARRLVLKKLGFIFLKIWVGTEDS